VSPILSGALAALIFFSVRFFVLRRKNAYNLSFWILPFFVLFTVFVNMCASTHPHFHQATFSGI